MFGKWFGGFALVLGMTAAGSWLWAEGRGCGGKGAGCCAKPAPETPTRCEEREAADKKDAAAIEAEIKAARAKLSKEDQVLVEAQEFCPMMPDSRLGEMGTPLKVMVKDQPVFLCCKGCQRKALANPEATLAKVAELKAKVKESKGKK